MHVTGALEGAHFSLNGNLIVSFAIDDKLIGKAAQEIEALKGMKLTIDAKKYRAKRSLDANAYFWKLVDSMAKVLLSDKDTVYLLQIAKYGVFQDVAIIDEAFDFLKKTFRYVEVLADMEVSGKPGKKVRCYAGSSTYDTKEMSDLINGTVTDAKALGIETLTPDEQAAMLAAWKGSGQIERGY